MLNSAGREVPLRRPFAFPIFTIYVFLWIIKIKFRDILTRRTSTLYEFGTPFIFLYDLGLSRVREVSQIFLLSLFFFKCFLSSASSFFFTLGLLLYSSVVSSIKGCKRGMVYIGRVVTQKLLTTELYELVFTVGKDISLCVPFLCPFPSTSHSFIFPSLSYFLYSLLSLSFIILVLFSLKFFVIETFLSCYIYIYYFLFIFTN